MNKLRFLLISLVITAFICTTPATVKASFLDNIVNGVKNIFSPAQPKSITIDSNISLAPEGDINKNNEIDSGDIVRFSYT